MSYKKTGLFIAGLAASLTAIFLIVQTINIKDTLYTLSLFNGMLIPVLLLLYAAGMFFRIKRWEKIIGSGVSFNFVAQGMFLGYMFNSLLPAKIGELVRILFVAKKEKITKSTLLASVVIERFFDIIIVFLFFGISVAFSSTVKNLVRENMYVILIMVCVVLFGITLLIFREHLFRRVRSYAEVRVNVVSNVINKLLDSFTIINSSGVVINAILRSLLIWSLTGVMVYIIINGLNIAVPFYAYFFVVSVSVFGMIIPSTAGGVGVYHAVAMGALLLFGVNNEKALSFAIISHALDFIPNVLLGLIVLIRNNYSLISIKNMAERE